MKNYGESFCETGSLFKLSFAFWVQNSVTQGTLKN